MPAPKDAEFRRRSLTTRSTVWVRKVDSATPLRWPLGPDALHACDTVRPA
jgi:hypothetical protein